MYPTVQATKRLVRHLTPRATAFYPVGNGVGEVLGAIIDRIFVVGAAPADWLKWGLTGIEGSWMPGAHYLSGHSPILRYSAFTDPQRKVEVMPASAWFGDGDYTVGDAWEAWQVLERTIVREFHGASLLATPATTGRELFLRTIPKDREWPVCSSEVQELIRATAGQGRIELVDGPETELPGLFEYDGRLMYAALCWGLPAGEPHRDCVDEFAGQQRGRYRVDFTVPADWPERFGLLGVLVDGVGGVNAWRYPHEPGATFTTWCDGAELAIALRCRWDIKIRERMLWPDYSHRGPLDTWAHKLVTLHQRDYSPYARNDLVRAAIRNMILHGIGAFVGREHVVTHTVPLSLAHTIPRDAVRVHRAGEWILWGEAQPAKWTNLAHPEWAAAVWARSRARLLHGPGPSGALHRYGEVVAFRTDAVTLTQRQAWPDDGKVGRLRLKRFHIDPLPRPRSALEFMTARDAGQTT